MGGELILRPVDVRYGTDAEQRYIFEIVGLDAAKFVAQMELTNFRATGTFDGTVPITFDSEGTGRIEGGLLISRAPGGNIAYLGELTYKDLGTIGNYAFQSLRSLDYSQMAVALDGNLTGEVITRFTFDGVRQGEGASRNFITRRLSKLPIRFKVNVRSEHFYQLTTLVRSIFDPEYLGNPVDRGLLTTENGRFVPAVPLRAPSPPDEPPVPADPLPLSPRREELPVQLPESEPSL